MKALSVAFDAVAGAAELWCRSAWGVRWSDAARRGMDYFIPIITVVGGGAVGAGLIRGWGGRAWWASRTQRHSTMWMAQGRLEHAMRMKLLPSITITDVVTMIGFLIALFLFVAVPGYGHGGRVVLPFALAIAVAVICAVLAWCRGDVDHKIMAILTILLSGLAVANVSYPFWLL